MNPIPPSQTIWARNGWLTMEGHERRGASDHSKHHRHSTSGVCQPATPSRNSLGETAEILDKAADVTKAGNLGPPDEVAGLASRAREATDKMKP
jgi:hypothetical protein